MKDRNDYGQIREPCISKQKEIISNRRKVQTMFVKSSIVDFNIKNRDL